MICGQGPLLRPGGAHTPSDRSVIRSLISTFRTLILLFSLHVSCQIQFALEKSGRRTIW